MAKIILVGYMGSGKSSVNPLLSSETGYPGYDLDLLIEQQQGMSIQQIFATKGEIAFRKLEHELLKQLITDDRDMVLSLGGGTPCYAGNDAMLTATGVHSVYLRTSVDTLFDRLRKDMTGRPLLKHIPEAELHEYIAKHLFDRSYYYNKAQYSVITDSKTPEQIAAEIKTLLA